MTTVLPSRPRPAGVPGGLRLRPGAGYHLVPAPGRPPHGSPATTARPVQPARSSTYVVNPLAGHAGRSLSAPSMAHPPTGERITRLIGW